MTRAALLALAALMLAGAAHAQDTSPQAASGQNAAPVAPDANTGQDRGGGGRGGMRMMREACATDMQTYCADAGRDRGARRQCMMANHDKFSPQCRDAMAKMEAWRQSHPRPDGGGAGGPQQ